MSTTIYKPYWEKLKDPRWQRKRLETMSRDGFRCRHCQSDDKTLDVHHCYYEKGKDPWDYEDDMLVCLCQDCHEETHHVNNFTATIAARGPLGKWRQTLNSIFSPTEKGIDGESIRLALDALFADTDLIQQLAATQRARQMGIG